MRYRTVFPSAALLAVASALTMRSPLLASGVSEPTRGAMSSRGAPRPDTLLLAKGRAIVGTICAACHTEQPPPKTAPPLSHVARRYRMMTSDSAAALARITAWIAAPAKDRSLMPSMAIDRFGLMAPLPLPEDQRRAAAAYVLSLADSAQGMREHGAEVMPAAKGRAGGGGMNGMRHGTHATRDTTR
jgi:cytochrome c